MSADIRYIAAPKHVREVTLRGTAVLDYWKKRLAEVDLIPVVRDDRAEVLITAASMTFMGLRFTEVSFSVPVVPAADVPHSNAALLLHAFNTSRMLAFSERLFFRTPYYYGGCRVSTVAPISIQLLEADREAFRAELRFETSGFIREPARRGYETWQGPIYLPTVSTSSGKRYMF
jgi:hypothetical protein